MTDRQPPPLDYAQAKPGDPSDWPEWKGWLFLLGIGVSVLLAALLVAVVWAYWTVSFG